MLIDTATEYTVSVPNQPGHLAKLAAALLRTGVDLAGIAGAEKGQRATVRFVDQAGCEPSRQLRAEGYNVKEQTVLVLDAPARADMLQRLTRDLAVAGVCVESFYGHAASHGSRWILAVDKPEQAAAYIERSFAAKRPERALAAA